MVDANQKKTAAEVSAADSDSPSTGQAGGGDRLPAEGFIANGY
jgi:hypothetical protein